MDRNARRRLTLGLLLATVIGMLQFVPVRAQDVTDPLTAAFANTDQIVVNRGHQRLAGNLYQLLPGMGVQIATCTMAAGTTCTATIAAYTGTPQCFPKDDAAAVAGTASVSTTTLTITAASSNSAVWHAICFGNPN